MSLALKVSMKQSMIVSGTFVPLAHSSARQASAPRFAYSLVPMTLGEGGSWSVSLCQDLAAK